LVPHDAELPSYSDEPGATDRILSFDVPKAAAKLSNIALWDSQDMNDLDGQTYGVIDL
jgi:hypothetical protein